MEPKKPTIKIKNTFFGFLGFFGSLNFLFHAPSFA